MKIIHRAVIDPYTFEVNEGESLVVYNKLMKDEEALFLPQSDAIDIVKWLSSKYQTIPLTNKTTIDPIAVQHREEDKIRKGPAFEDRSASQTVAIALTATEEPPMTSEDGKQKVFGEEVVDLNALAQKTGSPH